MQGKYPTVVTEGAVPLCRGANQKQRQVPPVRVPPARCPGSSCTAGTITCLAWHPDVLHAACDIPHSLYLRLVPHMCPHTPYVPPYPAAAPWPLPISSQPQCRGFVLSIPVMLWLLCHRQRGALQCCHNTAGKHPSYPLPFDGGQS